MAALCSGCHEPLAPLRHQGNPRKWCSESCRVRAFRQARPDYTRRQAERAAAHHRATYVATSHLLTCCVCTAVFSSKMANAKFCSATCRYRQAYLGRYARRAGARRERYTFLEIAVRDDWRCGICGHGVSPDLRYPDRLAGSIDHVLPLSLGGDDTRANVQLAHLDCNRRKSNRPDMGLTDPDMGGTDGRTRSRAQAC